MNRSRDESPRVFIGLATYNRPAMLREVLEAIRRQTWKSFTVLISDNCSPDPEVARVGREYAARDPRIRYHRQEENIGAGPNFAYLLEQAVGKYFVWAADDDLWSADYLRVAVEYLEAHADCVIASGAPMKLNPDGTCEEVRGNHRTCFTSKYGIVRLLQTYTATGPKLTHIYGVIRRDAARKIRIASRFGEDRYALAALAYLGTVVMLEQPRLKRRPGVSSSRADFAEFAKAFPEVGRPTVFHQRKALCLNAAGDVFRQDLVYGSWGLARKTLVASLILAVCAKDSLQKFYLLPAARKSRRLLSRFFRSWRCA